MHREDERIMTFRKFMLGLTLAVCAVPFATKAADDAPSSIPIPPPGTRSDSVLVSVNGEPITLLDVILENGSQEKELAGVYSGERLKDKTFDLRNETVDRIICRKLVYQKYKTDPFEIPRQDIENLLDAYVRGSGADSRASFEKSAQQYGITPENLRERAVERIAVEALLMRDCDHQVFVTPKEVYEEYKAHPEKWTVPEKISFQLLQINVTAGSAGGDPQAAVKAVRQELDKDSSRKNFTRLVLEKSDGASASIGGIMEDVVIDDLRPEFIEALKDKKADDVVGPIEAPEAFFFLRVIGTEPARLIPFSKANREVHDALYKERVEEKRKEYYDQLKRKAAIETFDN